MRLAEIEEGAELIIGATTHLKAGYGGKPCTVIGIGFYTEVLAVGCPGVVAHLLTDEEIDELGEYQRGRLRKMVAVRTKMKHFNRATESEEEIDTEEVVPASRLMAAPEYQAKVRARQAVEAAGKAHEQIERDILHAIEELVAPHLTKLGLTPWARPHTTHTMVKEEGRTKFRRHQLSTKIRIDVHESPDIRDPEVLGKLPKTTQAKLEKLFADYDAWAATPHPGVC